MYYAIIKVVVKSSDIMRFLVLRGLALDTKDLADGTLHV